MAQILLAAYCAFDAFDRRVEMSASVAPIFPGNKAVDSSKVSEGMETNDPQSLLMHKLSFHRNDFTCLIVPATLVSVSCCVLWIVPD